MIKRSALILLPVLIAIAAIALYWSETRNSGAHRLLLSEAIVAIVSEQNKVAMVTLKIDNQGGPQRVVSVASSDASSAHIMGLANGKPAIIPGERNASLAGDGAHIMLMGVDRPLDEGRLINISMTLDPAGTVATKARLVADMPMGHGAHAGMMTMAGSDEEGSHVMGQNHVVPQGEPKPSLSVSAAKSTDGTWQLDTAAENFQFSRELADGDHVPGTGHGHIYLNGLKLGRVYEKTTPIGILPPGEHIVSVTLNTNDHRALEVDGKTVEASTTISVD